MFLPLHDVPNLVKHTVYKFILISDIHLISRLWTFLPLRYDIYCMCSYIWNFQAAVVAAFNRSYMMQLLSLRYS
jgi:hypothetical protein